MAEVDGKHGLTEKEYTDDAAHNAAGRGQTATDQYVVSWKPVIIGASTANDSSDMGSRYSSSIPSRNVSLD
jgi:hypothetical protein